MKPIEDQALYRLGILENEVKHLHFYQKPDSGFWFYRILENEVKHLHAEKELLRQENELLREQVKILPGPSDLENKDNLILLLETEKKDLEKQMELLPAKPEKVTEILLQNAENIKFLQEELSSTAALAEKIKEQAEQEK